MMNILVCVKQVPDTTEIRIDPEKNTLIREGVPSILNPFDGYALEAAARIKDKDPDTKIVVVSMGPSQANAVLKEALSIAADKAYLVSDRLFGGSDTLATSYILANAIKKIEETEGKIDAVFCGKQAIDGDTAQVGPEIGEHLGLPQVTYGLEVEAVEGALRAKKEVEDGAEIIEVKIPCVVTFTKPSFDPRYPTIKRKLAANRAKIDVLTAAELSEIDPEHCGLKGSPTRVKKTFVPPVKSGGMTIEAETGEEAAAKLVSILSEEHLI